MVFTTWCKVSRSRIGADHMRWLLSPMWTINEIKGGLNARETKFWGSEVDSLQSGV
jgi:hypothetical protein